MTNADDRTSEQPADVANPGPMKSLGHRRAEINVSD